MRSQVGSSEQRNILYKHARIILLMVDLSCYKWYQSQTSGGVPVRTLNLEGGGYRAVY